MKDKFIISTKDASVQYLSDKDKRLAKVIGAIGDIECNIHAKPFEFIVGEIVGQMLSNKVADVITDRLYKLCNGKIEVDTIHNLSIDDLRGIGISKAKSQYILNFADAVECGQIDFNELKNMPDDKVMKTLMSVRGIGSWTSKMYLIFVLQRPDVLPYEDGAFMQAYKWLYKQKDVSKDGIIKKCKIWHPYSSIAARYLYRALDTGMTKQEFSINKEL